MKSSSKNSDLVVEGLLDYLKESGQEKLLPEVTDILETELGRSGKVENIVVVSAILLDETQLSNLKKLVERILGQKNLPITNKIDKNLLGGFTVRAGDWFLDASLARELNNLKNVLVS